MSEHRFVCADCREEKVHVNPGGCGGTGYGIGPAARRRTRAATWWPRSAADPAASPARLPARGAASDQGCHLVAPDRLPARASGAASDQGCHPAAPIGCRPGRRARRHPLGCRPRGAASDQGCHLVAPLGCRPRGVTRSAAGPRRGVGPGLPPGGPDRLPAPGVGRGVDVTRSAAGPRRGVGPGLPPGGPDRLPAPRRRARRRCHPLGCQPGFAGSSWSAGCHVHAGLPGFAGFAGSSTCDGFSGQG